MEENVFVEGLRTWNPHPNAPDFVKYEVEVTDMEEFVTFLKQNAKKRKDGKYGMRWTIKTAKSTNNPYNALNTFEPKPQDEKKKIEKLLADSKVENPNATQDEMPF